MAVWWSRGAMGSGTSTAGQPDLGQLGDGRAAGAAHEQVGRGEQQVHVVLVAHLLVEQAAVGQLGGVGAHAVEVAGSR